MHTPPLTHCTNNLLAHADTAPAPLKKCKVSEVTSSHYFAAPRTGYISAVVSCYNRAESSCYFQKNILIFMTRLLLLLITSKLR